MSVNTTVSTGSGKPCGCGGSMQATASGCGCGGASGKSCTCGGSGSCQVCQDPGFVRPNFFAGQLLTEEDLQLLGNYVVAKNRLHNRALFGAGVVCGLQVVCDPCKDGRVIVQPGYALDCCGNDIVVSCPQTLDINAMVRDLKLRLAGGHDCGDPCAQKPGSAAPPARNPAQPNTPAPGTGKQSSERQRYCLYIDYCEQLSDAVSPYATDNPCAPSACQPTRVREGFRFELRCCDPPEEAPSVCTSITSCLGDSTWLERVIADGSLLRSYGARSLLAYRSLVRQPSETPDADAFAAELNRHYSALSAVEGTAAVTADDDPRPLLEAVLRLGRDLALLRTQSAEEQRVLLAKLPNVEEVEKALQDLLNTLPPRIRDSLRSPLERAHAESMLHAVRRTLADQAALRAAGGYATLTDPAVRALAHGAVWGRALQNAGADSLATIRDWLLNRLQNTAALTHCDLLCEVRRVGVPVPTANEDPRLEEMDTFASASEQLMRLVRAVLRECLCNSLNPPCVSCDDPAVPLASVTVEQCRVRDICLLERDFVISPVSLRYWDPELGALGKALERLCCGECDAGQPPPEGERDPLLRVLAPVKEETLRPLLELVSRCLAQSKGARLPVLGASLFRASDETQGRHIRELQQRLSESQTTITRLEDEHSELKQRLLALEKRRPLHKQPAP